MQILKQSYAMKKIFLLVIISNAVLLKAQITLAVKSNLIFNTSSPNWTLSSNWSGNNNGIKEITNNSKDISGFNIGLSTTIKLPNIPLFLMPEIYYTTIGNKAVYIDSNGNLFNLKAKSNRIDIPVLAGITVIKPLRIFLGPVFSTNLHNSGSSGDFKTIHLNKFLLNYQIGASLHISHLIINVRYENSLSKDKQKFYNREKNILIDYKNRQGLFIMGIGYQF
jgi:hypothetical protein